ncbi:hypothetical protein [Brevibacillus sp. H7]|uniref:hypothetical protein n=1 Tax=Brevibacillus sp. H7 TaxID=3349138 RepID=UPI003807E1B9
MQYDTLFQAEPTVVNMLKNMKDTVWGICKQHSSRTVRIEAADGKVYEGKLVDCDGTNVYLEVEEEVREEEQERLEFVPVAFTYQPCYPYSPYCYPYPHYHPYPYPYPYPPVTAPIFDSPESPLELPPPPRRRRRCRRRIIPLALFDLLAIILL